MKGFDLPTQAEVTLNLRDSSINYGNMPLIGKFLCPGFYLTPLVSSLAAYIASRSSASMSIFLSKFSTRRNIAALKIIVYKL